MKQWLVVLCTLVMLYVPAVGHSGPKEDYEEAYKLYIMAGASVAAYSDRIGEMATRYLEQGGWTIDHYTQSENNAGARFLLAKKATALGKTSYVLAIVGTENANDIKLNFKVDKIYFAGSNSEEFVSNAAKKDVPDTQPKVHRGFDKFIQAGPKLRTASGSSLSLTDLLITHPENKLYLTGHSLGGAAATIAGARLIDMGVDPNQLEIITFGAPAVGNAAFAAKYEPALNITRVVISGDPVTGVLQSLVGDYQQFGREIKWDMPTFAHGPHNLPSYVDIALKNYYDKRTQALQAGVELPKPPSIKPVSQNRVYIAPLKNSLPPAVMTEFPYMREALLDEYRHALPNSVIANGTAGADWKKQAAAAGCRWVIIPEVSSIRLKEKKNIYHITLHQTVYETATGAVIDMAAFSTGTYNLTPLAAFIHAFKGLHAEESTWLSP